MGRLEGTVAIAAYVTGSTYLIDGGMVRQSGSLYDEGGLSAHRRAVATGATARPHRGWNRKG